MREEDYRAYGWNKATESTAQKPQIENMERNEFHAKWTFLLLIHSLVIVTCCPNNMKHGYNSIKIEWGVQNWVSVLDATETSLKNSTKKIS